MRFDRNISSDVSITSSQNPTQPGIADIARAQEAFVNGRQAIRGSRTPYRDLQRVIPEIHEAHAELHGSMRLTDLKGNFTEEVGDAAIFFISAAGALGILPHEIENEVEARLRKVSQLSLPSRREARRGFLREQLNALEVTAAEVTEMVENGTGEPNSDVNARVMDGIHQAFLIGEAVHPGMRTIVLEKIGKNTGRFTEVAFTIRGSEPPEVCFAIAYTRRKVEEGKLSAEDALARLQADPNIIAYGGVIHPHTLDLVEFS